MKKAVKVRQARRNPRSLVNVGQYTYAVIITPNDPDGYLVTCPALPGVVTQGDTFDEAGGGGRRHYVPFREHDRGWFADPVRRDDYRSRQR